MFASFIDERLLRISLLRVSVGSERSTAAALSESIPDSVVCKAFGEFDFVVLERIHTIEEHERAMDAKNLVDLQVIMAFGWSGITPSLQELTNHPLCLVTLFRVQPAYLTFAGDTGELQLATHLANFLKGTAGVSGGTAGGLGWSQLVLLIGAADFKSALRGIYAVRELGFLRTDTGPVFGSQNDRGYSPVFASSLTIPCVRVSPQGGPVEGGAWGDVRPQLQISCVPGSESWVATETSSLGVPSREFGAVDVAISTINVASVSEYVERLWGFRAQAGEKVHWTTTVLQLSMDEGSD